MAETFPKHLVVRRPLNGGLLRLIAAFAPAFLGLWQGASSANAADLATNQRPPNVVLIFADDK